ncbi:23S rRNA (uracil(747)-C(5))-methyltransferase RlmC [Paramicrobacterium agarici]|uniref:23S rRNA (uracil(747)-C(5))-methyltransferase RlmC n=1 Tax=Paramicrobacterium agarici TaxID=630514 RepID=UPI001152BD2C|nr:23S rRNA (uracil(747)-C(5))-methyltransferase RlmC [Microbacterium agarici]TQO24176.1 23S rRNA m(5)U-747 methyltransferase [Microbacterium agarici]
MHCAYFDAGACRSCSLMGSEYASQVSEKEHHCRSLLSAYPDVQWLEPVTSVESEFRNKAKMVVGGSIHAPTLGILARDRSGVDLRECGVLQPGIRAALPAVSRFITAARVAPYDVAARHGELKYVLLTESASGGLMLRFVLRSREAVSRIRKHLPDLQRALPRLDVCSINLQPEHKAVIEGEHEIALTSARSLMMPVGDIALRLGARSFFQTNTAVAERMYAQAREWCDAAAPRSVWDLYCGVGGFALHLADGSRDVMGIEVSAEAIESARTSARDAALENVRFTATDAADFAVDQLSEQSPDLVVVNPPRRGIGTELARALERSTVRTVIYSSCNAVSLAKDLQAMPSLVPKQARVLDMFPQTRHYETMVLLQRR